MFWRCFLQKRYWLTFWLPLLQYYHELRPHHCRAVLTPFAWLPHYLFKFKPQYCGYTTEFAVAPLILPSCRSPVQNLGSSHVVHGSGHGTLCKLHSMKIFNHRPILIYLVQVQLNRIWKINNYRFINVLPTNSRGGLNQAIHWSSLQFAN